MAAAIKIENISTDGILLVTFGGGKTTGLTKTRIRKVIDGEDCFFQEERILNNKAFHKNIPTDDIYTHILSLMKEEFKNSVIYTKQADYYIRRTKKGALSIMKRGATKEDLSPASHNTEKSYLIPEGKPIGFLVELGIMSKEGQVFKKHYSKFRQINRFLEFIDDSYKIFEDNDIVSIADLCCGKGYLTLALHYYFTVVKSKKVKITGVDLKKDVIVMLNSVVEKLCIDGINFHYGDITDTELNNPNIVVALHACDTATDIALAKAVNSEADLILSVPCCQHELFNQIKNEDLSPILKYGVMKDKFTELSTNALRGLALEASGYTVKMIEFTTLEHTMKNIMIKAERTKKTNSKAYEEFHNFCKLLDVTSSAEKIMK